MSRLINNPQPPSLAALRVAEGKRATRSSNHMSMASMQSTGLESLVNMVQGASRDSSIERPQGQPLQRMHSTERTEQQQLQSQRERPGFPGSESRNGGERLNETRFYGNGNSEAKAKVNEPSAASKAFWGEQPAKVSPLEPLGSHRV
jgi:hypothetical protein